MSSAPIEVNNCSKMVFPNGRCLLNEPMIRWEQESADLGLDLECTANNYSDGLKGSVL
jgi:hypothetical protein